jgi:RNA polymerase sigma-70 factor, ECF subfamily
MGRWAQLGAMTVIPRSVSADTDVSVWIARCREGDPTAFRALYDLHFQQVHRLARSLGAPAAEVDDVTQEVFSSAFSKLSRFSGGNFGHWLHRICANLVTDRHRKRRVRETFQRLLGSAASEEMDHRGTPDARCECAEAQRQVGQILARMRPKHREVFALFELEGLSGEEISVVVGCPVNTVWTRLHHARQDFLKIGRKRGWIDPERGTS